MNLLIAAAAMLAMFVALGICLLILWNSAYE